MDISWNSPQADFIKVNVDGSFRKGTGSTACGGLIRDSNGRMLRGFYSKLGTSNAVWAELSALHLGIKLARRLHLSKVVFEMDSEVAVHMVQTGSTSNLFLQPLLHDTININRQLDWRTTVQHTYREANRRADLLANKGHSRNLEWTIINRACPFLGVILSNDVRGFSMPQMVM